MSDSDIAGTITKQAPLEDLMAAMDVVDTLRHERGIAMRELDGEGRQERLLERLKELYQAQGIEVSEQILQEGIDALEQERFQYRPVTPSWRTKLANLWVSRRRWGKPFGAVAVLGSLFSGVYFVTDVIPERELRTSLPGTLQESIDSISKLAKNPLIVDQARNQIDLANQSIKNNNFDKAQQIQASLNSVISNLQRYYIVRVISRPGESSGVWRIPDANQQGRNYYLIVEAIDRNNKVIDLDVLNEETNKRNRVKTWGIRVNEETFYKIAADKNDDGIIQLNQVGEKLVGYLKPKFSIPTTGGTITKWN